MASYRPVAISELTPGSVLATPVFDDRLVKLLDAGTTVDQYLIARLRLLGITEVVVDSSAESLVSYPQKTLSTGAHRRPANSVPVEHCSVCRMNIALDTPAPNSTASVWRCQSCGAVYFGRSEEGQERRGILRVDPAVHNPFVAGNAPSIPPEYIKRLAAKSDAPDQYTGPDPRLDKRYPVAMPVVALPLGSDFRVTGEPVQMMTANVSLGGAALIHTRFVDAPNLALDYMVAGIDLQVVFKVLRVRSLGLVYEIAGEFLSQLSLQASDTTTQT